MIEFREFGKIPRLNRECVVTEKIDGTNGCVIVSDDGLEIAAASRSRIITPNDDNHGFAAWVEANRADLLTLGPGYHYGEWWGEGINKRYRGHIVGKRFSLFNVSRWGESRPSCCGIVPVLARGLFTTALVNEAIESLRRDGSVAAPGCMRPEGVVIYHHASNSLFKATLEKDAEWKGKASQEAA